jgi:hypothetical protein
MAPEKEERAGATVKKTGEAGDDTARRTSGTQSRITARDSGNGGDGGLVASPPARRRERYIIGTRAAPGGQSMAHPQHSMDDVVQYLNQQENVEVVKRIKLGGTQPFTAQGRSGN